MDSSSFFCRGRMFYGVYLILVECDWLCKRPTGACLHLALVASTSEPNRLIPDSDYFFLPLSKATLLPTHLFMSSAQIYKIWLKREAGSIKGSNSRVFVVSVCDTTKMVI